MQKRALTGIVLLTGTLGLGACGGDSATYDADNEGDNTGTTLSASGVTQKGPFRAGGTASAVQLASDGSLTSTETTGTIDDRGQYELTGIDWTGATEIQMEGTFYDETTANFSSESRTLTAVTTVESGQPLDTNVNLYTYFVGERTKVLMGDGQAIDAALTTARSDLQAALGISNAPADLNLLETLSGLSEDSANLLLFSAAVQKGGIGQAGLDELAADFADDGQFNGNGADELSTIQQEGTDALLSEVRTNLQNQYGTTPPDGGAGGFGWMLSDCASAKLTEPRVFCSGEEYTGTLGNDDGEAILFYPQETGFYSFDLSGSNLSSFASWTLYSDSLDGSEVGDASSADGDTTTFALDAGEPYAFSLFLSGLSAPQDAFTLRGEQVSQGDAFDPKVIEADTTYDAMVGKVFVNSSQGNGSATSWYLLDGASGSHTVTVEYDFPAVSSGGGLGIDVYEADGDQETVNDLNSLTRLDFVNGDGGASNSLTVNLDGDKNYFILITNLFTDFRRVSSSSEAYGSVGFDLTVTSN